METGTAPRLADRPTPRGPLPPARAMLWRVWRQALCRDLGLEEAAIPTPAALWRLLHRGRAMPRGATWADLLRDADAGHAPVNPKGYTLRKLIISIQNTAIAA